MKQTIRLNENELRNLINECVVEIINEETDEGILKNIGRGLKNAFGGDAQRLQSGAQKVGNVVKQGVQRVGNTIQQGAQKVGNNMQQGMQNFGQGVQQRWQAGKAGFQAEQNNGKIQKLIQDIQNLQQSGVLTGPATTQAINALMKQLKGAQSRNKGMATAYRNQIGNNQNGQQAVNEAVLNYVINEVIRQYL